tara:strand:+ start:29 stop:622 length:594 start_codon:yes stop_codon:yes gene_type:complete
MPKTIGYNDHFHGGYETFTTGETGGPVFLERQMLADVAQATFDIPFNVYKAYTWRFYNISTASNGANLVFQVNSQKDETITSSAVRAYNNEAGDDNGVGYRSGEDQSQGTSAERLQDNIGYDPKESCSGFFTMYDPSSETFVKHFMSEVTTKMNGSGPKHDVRSGYINYADYPIFQVHFYASSGNLKSGTIAMYGIL